ncbi:hypothetical protein K1719_040690 [Acacia pycnantha]|nr:hypothetical protein K1719_040690 [Acacia pycnantha]
MASSFSGVTSFIVLVFLCVAVHIAYGTDQENNRPVMFIFGDSTADVGTNNFLTTQAKGNVPYYGIDFPNSVPTRRFSNGFNIIDHIAQLFGYEESPPPYLALLNDRHTGRKQWGEVVALGEQVEQFQAVKASLVETLETSQTATFLSKALFIISVGANDLLEFSTNKSSITLGPQQYLAALQFDYYTQILNLYAVGVRRFGIISVAAIGCSVLKGPAKFGIKETNKACCGVGKLNGEGPYLKAINAELCEDHNEFLFWDWFHPTDKASKLAASSLFDGPSNFAFPINFRQLAHI